MSKISPFLSVQNLEKTYPREREAALRDVSFEIHEGEIFGLLGPNGAGKSTAINIIAGLLSSDAGQILLNGKDFSECRDTGEIRMNISTAYSSLPYPLTVQQNLTIFSYLYGIENKEEKIHEVLTLFGIEHLRHKKVGKLSAGQTARVNLCKAFLNDPKLLLLDEPTASLDPELAVMIRKRLKELQKERGLTILWTSHNMPEVEEVCDRIAFLLHGSIHLIDTPANILKRFAVATMEQAFLKVAEQQKEAMPIYEKGRS